MPNIDLDAKAWQEAGSKRFGQAIASLRVAQGLTAVQLSARTKELGYPITRSTIARIEGDHRAGKVDLAELIVLAAALNTSPLNLIYPGPYDDDVEVLPGRETSALHAAQWFSGIYWYDWAALVDANDAVAAWNNATEPLRLWRLLVERRQNRARTQFRMISDGTITDAGSRDLLSALDAAVEELEQRLGIGPADA